MKTSQLICIAAFLGLAMAGMAGAADVTFAANGTFADGSTLSGSLIIDTATGIVQSNGIDLTVAGGELGGGSLTFDTLSFGGEEEADGSVNIWYALEATDSAEQGPRLELDLDLGSATSLVNYAGGALCYEVPDNSADNNCGESYSTWILGESENPGDPALTGTSSSLTLASAPEPASVWLLAVPAVWAIRRRRLS